MAGAARLPGAGPGVGPRAQRLALSRPVGIEADRGSVFFGRELAIAQAVERLRQAATRMRRARRSCWSSAPAAPANPRCCAPGCCRASPCPARSRDRPLAHGDRDAGPSPHLALAESLLSDAALGPELREGAFPTEELLARQLAGDLDMAVAALRAALDMAAERRRSEAQFEAVRPVRLALAIDQVERLFVETDAATAASFAALLEALVRQNLAYVIIALRSDAYARFQSLESLVGSARGRRDARPRAANRSRTRRDRDTAGRGLQSAAGIRAAERPFARCAAGRRRQGRRRAALAADDAVASLCGGDRARRRRAALCRLSRHGRGRDRDRQRGAGHPRRGGAGRTAGPDCGSRHRRVGRSSDRRSRSRSSPLSTARRSKQAGPPARRWSRPSWTSAC